MRTEEEIKLALRCIGDTLADGRNSNNLPEIQALSNAALIFTSDILQWVLNYPNTRVESAIKHSIKKFGKRAVQ